MHDCSLQQWLLSLMSGLLGSVVGALITVIATTRMTRREMTKQFERDNLAGRREAIELIYSFVSTYMVADAKAVGAQRELAARLEAKARFLDTNERNAIRDVLAKYGNNPSEPIDHRTILGLKDHAQTAESACCVLERRLME